MLSTLSKRFTSNLGLAAAAAVLAGVEGSRRSECAGAKANLSRRSTVGALGDIKRRLGAIESAQVETGTTLAALDARLEVAEFDLGLRGSLAPADYDFGRADRTLGFARHITCADDETRALWARGGVTRSA